jgi:hypothetical protein
MAPLCARTSMWSLSGGMLYAAVPPRLVTVASSCLKASSGMTLASPSRADETLIDRKVHSRIASRPRSEVALVWMLRTRCGSHEIEGVTARVDLVVHGTFTIYYVRTRLHAGPLLFLILLPPIQLSFNFGVPLVHLLRICAVEGIDAVGLFSSVTKSEGACSC